MVKGPRILVVNANTTESFTEACRKAAEAYARSGTEIVAVTATRGPRSIEGWYDEYLATVGVIEAAKKTVVKEKIDAIIIGCYGDPGINALKEVFDIPVIGIAEASMYMACILGFKFSVLSILKRFKPFMELVVRRYGLESRCASIRATDISVLEFEEDRDASKRKLVEEGKKAVEEDEAEVILLGCTGMAGLDKELEEELGVPVLDGLVCAVKMAEAFYDYKLKPSKILAFKKPEVKEVYKYPKIFQPE